MTPTRAGSRRPGAPRSYKSWAAAQHRVNLLRQHAGIWPGIMRSPGGGYRLTYDPPVAVDQLDSHGYLGPRM